MGGRRLKPIKRKRGRPKLMLKMVSVQALYDACEPDTLIPVPADVAEMIEKQTNVKIVFNGKEKKGLVEGVDFEIERFD
jgi:hypothetical protein